MIKRLKLTLLSYSVKNDQCGCWESVRITQMAKSLSLDNWSWQTGLKK